MRPFLGDWHKDGLRIEGVVIAMVEGWPVVITDIGAVVTVHTYRGHLGFVRWVTDDEDPISLYRYVEGDDEQPTP